MRLSGMKLSECVKYNVRTSERTVVLQPFFQAFVFLLKEQAAFENVKMFL